MRDPLHHGYKFIMSNAMISSFVELLLRAGGHQALHDGVREETVAGNR
jgi:hypothetical protein